MADGRHFEQEDQHPLTGQRAPPRPQICDVISPYVLKVDSENEVGLIIVLRQHRTGKFAEIAQNNGHYAVQGHSRSPILVPIDSTYTISY